MISDTPLSKSKQPQKSLLQTDLYGCFSFLHYTIFRTKFPFSNHSTYLYCVKVLILLLVKSKITFTMLKWIIQKGLTRSRYLTLDIVNQFSIHDAAACARGGNSTGCTVPKVVIATNVRNISTIWVFITFTQGIRKVFWRHLFFYVSWTLFAGIFVIFPGIYRRGTIKTIERLYHWKHKT